MQHRWSTTPNIVGCYLHVASVCTPCCLLLDVVTCCCAKFETGQTFIQQLPTFLLFRDRRSIAQHCWGHARSLHMLYEDLWVVSSTIQQQHCWELLHPFANHCQHARNNSQNCGATMLGAVASVCMQPKGCVLQS